jgi:hypothetical protein
MSINVLQIHKRASYEFQFIQDKYAIDADKKLFSLADGTTQSFNSELWASLLTNAFITQPAFEISTLLDLFKEKASEYNSFNFNFSTNPAKAALERDKKEQGGTSTFIGLQIVNANNVEVITCGDSNLFILNYDGSLKTFPFADVEQLDECTYFINSKQLIENKITDIFFKKIKLKCEVGDTLILATDAISRLILKKPSILFELIKITHFEELLNFCNLYWDNKELQEDDISIITIPISDCSEVNEIKPPIEFSFPRENEIEFNINTTTTNLFSDMQFNEIRNQFNGVAQDFDLVKKKLKLHDTLLVLSLGLLLLNILFVYYSSDNGTNTNKKTETNRLEKKINHLNSQIIDLGKNRGQLEKTIDSLKKVIRNKK